ncbi:MAG: potassium channel family protein [archaeon]
MDGKVKVTSAFMLVILLLGTGTVVYSALEKWNYVDALYFSTTTLATVDSGNLQPTTQTSKLFTIFYIIAGLSVGLLALTAIANYIFENKYAPIYESTKVAIKEGIIERMRRRRCRL